MRVAITLACCTNPEKSVGRVRYNVRHLLLPGEEVLAVDQIGRLHVVALLAEYPDNSPVTAAGSKDRAGEPFPIQ